MEQFSFQQAPQFNTPEEEIAYLRAHIAEREGLLGGESHPDMRRQVTEQTIRAYTALDRSRVLTPKQVLPEPEMEALVLALKPEPHDKTMEELLGILMDKGIKNTLDVVNEIDNPHLTDDFHRFLVQYLASVKSVPGLKESSPVWKGLAMTLFEITLPEASTGESKGYKDFIRAMEQFYAGMLSLGGWENNQEQYYTLEIALTNNGSQVLVFAAVPNSKIDLFEKQVLGFYHDAKVRVVTDDYNIFTERGHTVGSIGRVSESPVFMLKTHEAIDHDPMNVLVNTFTKLKDAGEGAAVQFVIRPKGDQLVKQYGEVLRRIKDEGLRARDALNRTNSFVTTKGVTDFFFNNEKDLARRKEHINERDVENVTAKIKSPVVEVGVRLIASAETQSRAESMLREIESAFNQFYDPNGNAFIFSQIAPRSINEFLYDYSFRQCIDGQLLTLNLTELATVFHFPIGLEGTPELKQSKAATAPAPMEIVPQGVLLGTNEYRGQTKEIRMGREDRVRHFYVIGQTGTGKTTILKNMIIQDIKNGDGVCFIDPHGSDIQDILANIPRERIDDVIYFDPAYTPRPMGLNMLEYDVRFPEQKTFVVNELLAIFNKLFDMKTAGGPAFEQYFRNSALLVMEDPESGSTLLEIGRVLADKTFRDLKLARCKNPIIKQFWDNAEKTSGEQSLANFVPYVTNKFDVFVSNDIMRPIIAQQESVFNFRDVMDNKKILLVNLSKGRLGDINANLIGLILVGKMTMAALSRVDILGTGKPVNDFYLYIDEFQNVTTDSIATILSEARKYRLSLNIAHQYIEQLEDNIKNAVFGNVGSMAVFRVSAENAEVFSKQFEPTFTPADIIKLENFNCYAKMLVGGMPVKPFNIKTLPPPKGTPEIVDKVKELSYLKFGRDRAEVEEEIMARYKGQFS